MSSLRPSVALLGLVARRAAPRHALAPSTAGILQRRFLLTSASSSTAAAAASHVGSSSGSQQRDKANPNKHKQWYRELVPAALPALAIGLGVYMALHLLRLSLSAERELLALNAQVTSLEAELADLQERHGRSVSSTLREMFSKAAGGQGVVDALTNDAKDGTSHNDADSETTTTTIAPDQQQPSRSWWSWGRS